MEWSRRHWRDCAAVWSVWSAGHDVFAHMPAYVALDTLHVVVPADIADRVALALGELTRRRRHDSSERKGQARSEGARSKSLEFLC